jgi:hypothetical protein
MTTLHAHVSTASADCDGPMYDEYIMTLSEQEQGAEFVEISFRERVIASIVSVTGGRGTLVVDSEPGGWATNVAWHQGTEEGYRSAEARFCEDDCDLGERSHRDVYAEMMGY